MFGVPIQQVIDKQGPSGGKFPIVLRDTITFIFENKGYLEEGLFRLSGRLTEINALKKLYDTGQPAQQALKATDDVNTVTGLLKLYLRELPESLFTAAMLPKFYKAIEDESESNKLKLVKDLLRQLPPHCRVSLHELFDMLRVVYQHVSYTLMGLDNLSLIFVPVLKINYELFIYCFNTQEKLFRSETICGMYFPTANNNKDAKSAIVQTNSDMPLDLPPTLPPQFPPPSLPPSSLLPSLPPNYPPPTDFPPTDLPPSHLPDLPPPIDMPPTDLPPVMTSQSGPISSSTSSSRKRLPNTPIRVTPSATPLSVSQSAQSVSPNQSASQFLEERKDEPLPPLPAQSLPMPIPSLPPTNANANLGRSPPNRTDEPQEEAKPPTRSRTNPFVRGKPTVDPNKAREPGKVEDTLAVEKEAERKRQLERAAEEEEQMFKAEQEARRKEDEELARAIFERDRRRSMERELELEQELELRLMADQLEPEDDEVTRIDAELKRQEELMRKEEARREEVEKKKEEEKRLLDEKKKQMEEKRREDERKREEEKKRKDEERRLLEEKFREDERKKEEEKLRLQEEKRRQDEKRRLEREEEMRREEKRRKEEEMERLREQERMAQREKEVASQQTDNESNEAEGDENNATGDEVESATQRAQKAIHQKISECRRDILNVAQQVMGHVERPIKELIAIAKIFKQINQEVNTILELHPFQTQEFLNKVQATEDKVAMARQLLKNEILLISQRLKEIDSGMDEIADRETLFRLGKALLSVHRLITTQLAPYLDS